MPNIGYLQVNAYTSQARIPIQDVAVTVKNPSGPLIAMRLTNRNGQFPAPIPLEVPALSASQTPDTGTVPYLLVDLYARAPGYEEIDAKNLQIFPNTVTGQDLELIPLSEFPEKWNHAELFNTPPQNL